jgi:hypothetical protein
MKFSPCTDQCTSDGTHCQGCGRSHNEIKETNALIHKVVAHMIDYGYDNPENFLTTLNKKALNHLNKIQSMKCKNND